MEKPTICFFTQQYGYLWSGLGTYATSLIDTLAERGYRITVVSHEEPGRQAGKLHKNIRLITVPQTKFDPSIGHWFSLSFKYAGILKRYKEVKDCDIFHFTDAREALQCPVLPKPCLGTMHDYYYADVSRNPFYFKRFYHDWVRRYLYYHAVHLLEPTALRKLSTVICNSRFVKDMLLKKYRIPEDKLRVIYLGIKTENRTVYGKPAALEGSPSLLFVGANFQRKGLPILIRAVDSLRREFPAVKVYVIGKDANEGKMKKLCGDLGLSGHFKFLGWRCVEEVATFYRRADLFVMPSLIEGFGYTFLEAMSAGIPVIGGNVGGTRELITDAVNGFLVDPADHRQLADRIRMIIENPALKEKILTNAFETVRKFSLEKIVDETAGLYEEILCGALGGQPVP